MYLTRCYRYFFKVLATKLDILQNRNISVVGFYRWSYSKILPRPGTITFTNDSIILVAFQPAAMFKQSVQLWGILHTWSWIGRVLLSVWGRNYSLTIHWSFMQRRYVSYDQIKQQIVSIVIWLNCDEMENSDWPPCGANLSMRTLKLKSTVFIVVVIVVVVVALYKFIFSWIIL